MSHDHTTDHLDYSSKFIAGKDLPSDLSLTTVLPDSLLAWVQAYLQLVITGVRSPAVAAKITLHLGRFTTFFTERYSHDRLSSCLRRDVAAWQTALRSEGLAPATVNNHLASLSAFTTWVQAHDPRRFAAGDPAKGIGDVPLPALEPRALSQDQVRSLKNLCDRLPRLHQLKGRRWTEHQEIPTRASSRPYRDRAIIFVLLSTGLRREELSLLDLHQVEPSTPSALRAARKATIRRVRGKGKTERSVFLSADAREALADYLECERALDMPTDGSATALFLNTMGTPRRALHGRLAPRTINAILEQIGRWHDAEIREAHRRISPLRPHDLRHTFAFQLSQATGADAYELERRLGHRSQRYIQRYTNPPEEVAATYIEEF